jgi:hypothetical protein
MLIMPEYPQQLGIIGEREPSLCAVSGKPVKGKHANTYYKGDGKHFVRVLNAYDDQWKDAAPYYDFPVPVIQENEPSAEPVFVLPETEIIPVSGSNGPVGSFAITSTPASVKTATKKEAE